MATQRQLEFLERRVDGMSARADALLERQIRDREEEQARADADLETARRQKARSYAEGCRQFQARYDDSYAAFSVQVPQARRRRTSRKISGSGLFNRLVRKLPEGHTWSDTRADDLPLGPAMDKIEQMILEAAKLEGENPSIENLPEDGTIIERTRLDDTRHEVHEVLRQAQLHRRHGQTRQKSVAHLRPKDRPRAVGRAVSESRLRPR